MKSNILKTTLTFFLSAMLFVACEDEPTSLGIENIPPGDKIGLLELNSLETPMEQNSGFYNAGVTDTTWNLGTSIRLFVGKNQNINSSMLIRFRSAVADSIIDYYENGTLTIEKAWIEMKPVYTLGESSSQLSLEISKINSDWTSVFFTKDSLEQQVRPYLSDTRTITNLDTPLISFDISNEMATDWLISSIKDSTELNYGLLFEPTNNSDKFYGFYSLHESNIVDGYDKIPVAKIVVNKAGSDLDTLNFYSLRDVNVVDGELPHDDGTHFYLQGGFPVRANYFIDVSSIPENSIIVDAVLNFYYDPDLTFTGTSGSNTINLFMYSDSANRELLSGTGIRSLQKDSLENKYSGNITPFIQLWNQDTENQGLYVYIPDEQYTLNRIAIYGSKFSDPLLRPKLTIRYTKR